MSSHPHVLSACLELVTDQASVEVPAPAHCMGKEGTNPHLLVSPKQAEHRKLACHTLIFQDQVNPSLEQTYSVGSKLLMAGSPRSQPYPQTSATEHYWNPRCGSRIESRICSLHYSFNAEAGTLGLSCSSLSPAGSRLPKWLSCKESACQAGNLDWIPRLGRSPGEGNGNPR